jgi:hypothetical protein
MHEILFNDMIWPSNLLTYFSVFSVFHGPLHMF